MDCLIHRFLLKYEILGVKWKFLTFSLCTPFKIIVKISILLSPLKEFWKIYTLQAELPHRIHTKMKLFPYYVNWIVWSLGISYIQMPSLANNTSRTKHCAKSLVHWSDWSDMVWKVALCCEFSSFHDYRALRFF